MHSSTRSSSVTKISKLEAGFANVDEQKMNVMMEYTQQDSNQGE